MTHFHAVMLDECGQEFGAGVEAANRDEAYEMLREDYPENRGIVQLESPADTAKREADIYARACAEYGDEDFDDEDLY